MLKFREILFCWSSTVYIEYLDILPHYPWTTCGEFWLLCFSGAHGRFRSGGAKEKFHAAKQSLSVESFWHPFRGTSISYAGRHGYGKRHVKAPRDEAVDSLKCCNVQSLSNGNARHIETRSDKPRNGGLRLLTSFGWTRGRCLWTSPIAMRFLTTACGGR